MRNFSSSESLFNIRRLTLGLTMVGAAALSACGGGGGDNSATASGGPTVDRYVGTWVTACQPGTGRSGQVQIIITAAGANKAKAEFSGVSYASNNCSGASQTIPGTSYESENTFTGTKTVGDKLVDKVKVKEGSDTYNYILFNDGTNLIMGDDDSISDSEGYPTALATDLDLVFKRK
jgi:hypothetical protein